MLVYSFNTHCLSLNRDHCSQSLSISRHTFCARLGQEKSLGHLTYFALFPIKSGARLTEGTWIFTLTPTPPHSVINYISSLCFHPPLSRWSLLVFGLDEIRTCAVHGMLWTASWWWCLGLTSLFPWQQTRKVPFWVYYACFAHWELSGHLGKYRPCQAVLCTAFYKMLLKLIDYSSSLNKGNRGRDVV